MIVSKATVFFFFQKAVGETEIMILKLYEDSRLNYLLKKWRLQKIYVTGSWV